MIQAGLYQSGSDTKVDRAIANHSALDIFMTRRNEADTPSSFRALRNALTVGVEGAKTTYSNSDLSSDGNDNLDWSDSGQP
jgi:hypothetical protein